MCVCVQFIFRLIQNFKNVQFNLSKESLNSFSVKNSVKKNFPLLIKLSFV